MADDDDSFASLSLRLRNRIDSAFDRASPSYKPPTTIIAAEGFLLDDAPGGFLLDDTEQEAGGFLLDDTAPDGGFVPPSRERSPSNDALPSDNDTIPLSCIPHALQILDLSPDDEEVIDVFRNAASGWIGNGPRRRQASEDEAADDELVNRKDWRAVCAALMGNEEQAPAVDEDIEMVEDDGEEEDGEQDESNLGAGSSDEYVEPSPSKPTKRKRKTVAATSKSTPLKGRRRKNKPVSDEDIDVDFAPRPLTARQKRECFSAFSLFFPGVSEEFIQRKRIGIKELTGASDLLKEKIKIEEMLDMLETFSTSPDKTMGLADFEKMMVATRLV